MIDSPSTHITITPPTVSDAKEENLEEGSMVTVHKSKPITASIRKTIHHLHATAGWTARFRGLLQFILYGMAFFFVANIIEAILPRFIGSEILVSAGTGALVAPLHAAWTHKVISMPSTKKYKELIPARSTWKALLLPAAVKNSVTLLSVYVLAFCIFAFNFQAFVEGEKDGNSLGLLGLRIVGLIAVGLFLSMFIILPASVTLIRVEASILPEEDDTIVPFDRTFGGKVVPRVLGGTGAVSFLDAWRSFNWVARRRLIKLYIKITAIMSVLFFLFIHIVGIEMYAIMGPAVKKWVDDANERGLFDNSY